MPRRSRANRPTAQAAAPESGGGTRSGGLGNAERVQRAFGHHDISSIAIAHSVSRADAFGAAAMAQGESITLGSASDLHTLAHEAAHVVQQRAGVSLQGGVGSEGDRYERNADAVADLVVQGRSAESLLDQFTGGRALGKTAAPGQGVQRKKKKTVSGSAMARIKHAKAGIEHTKEVLSLGAGNQKEALEASNFNAYFRMAAMRDPECWVLSPSVRHLAAQYPDALTAAKADLAKGGNCGEHAQVGFDYLRATAVGETINRVDVEGLDHAFVMLGDAKAEDGASLVICDPWPTAPTACLWEDHFAYEADKSKLNVRHTAKADGADVKSVIARGLRLSRKGHAWVNHSLSADETQEKIKEGTEGEKPWIWEHANAVGWGKDYEYEAAAPAVETPAVDTPAVDASGPSTSSTGSESTDTAASGGWSTESRRVDTTLETARIGQSDTFGRRSPTAPPRRD